MQRETGGAGNKDEIRRREKMIWYPYEQLKTMKAPYEIVDANGVYLYTKDQKMIDSVSSWWR